MTSSPHITLLDRVEKERFETRELAPYACLSVRSRGRRFPEEPDPFRTCYERDRDRILHSTAFRRLTYKTQVFVNSAGDHNRTRLSHSLEVCQVARSIGAALRLNEPLCETLALTHDIGHPPFGHGGEESLNRLMADFGGFRHNAHVLRVVDQLERRRPDQAGLNLTYEVREALLKHEGEAHWPAAFRPRLKHPSLEGQVVDLADSTAYNKHDIEDGLLADMFTEEELFENVVLWREACQRVDADYPGFRAETPDRKLAIARTANELIGACILDIIQATHAELVAAAPADAHAARETERRCVRHSARVAEQVAELQRFLYTRFYRHERLQEFRHTSAEVLSTLFEHYRRCPDDLPQWYGAWSTEVGSERSICDYIAGMTDRFAQSEYERVTLGDEPQPDEREREGK